MAVLRNGKLMTLGWGIHIVLAVHLITLMPNLTNSISVCYLENKQNPEAYKPRKVSLDKVIKDYFAEKLNKLL